MQLWKKRQENHKTDLMRQRIVFFGWVQGVGFRWSMQAASRFGATGWVRNDPSGSVTMEIQGTQDEIDNVILAIRQSPYISIDRMEVETIPLKEGEQGFQPLLL